MAVKQSLSCFQMALRCGLQCSAPLVFVVMLLRTGEGDWCFDDVGRAVQLVCGGASISLQYVVLLQFILWCRFEDLLVCSGVGFCFKLSGPV